MLDASSADSVESADHLIRKSLSHGGDINGPVMGGHPALYWAVSRQHENAVKSLLKNGALPSTADDDGENPLHAAAEKGDFEIMRLLLAPKYRDALNAFDYIDRTPLMVAIDEGEREMVKLLLGAGADVNAHCEEKIGDTALRKAVEAANLEMVKLLLGAGADPFIPGWMGLTPIHKAQELTASKRKASRREIGKKMLRGMKNARGVSVKRFMKHLLPPDAFDR